MMWTKERKHGNVGNVHVEPCRPSKGFRHIQMHPPFSLSVWGVNSCIHWDCLYSLTLICGQVAADLLYGRIKFLGPQWLKLTSHSICLKFGDMGVWISRACFLFTWHFIFLSMIFITSSSSPSSINSNIPIISTTLLIL